MLASTRSAKGLRCSMWRRFSSSTSCWASHMLSRFKPVSYSPPWRAATTLSAAGWDVPHASGDMATSRISAPASPEALYAIRAAVEGGDDALRCRLGCSPCKRRHGDIQDFGACLDGGHVCHRRHSARAVGMNVDGDFDQALEGRHELPRRLRAEQAGRVLDHDLVAAHVYQALGQRTPQLEVVGGRDGVAQSALHLLLRLQCGPYRRLHVAEVVERIEDAEHVDAALGRVLDEELDHVIGEVALGDEVLSAAQRLDGRVRSRLVQAA